MKLNRSSVHYLTPALLLALFFTANSALAGPPLLCHAFDIGNAKSLPWISHDWNLTGKETYGVNNLIADTIAILDTDPTVLVTWKLSAAPPSTPKWIPAQRST